MTIVNRKPDFLIIGVQKSATTWLQECLRQHPSVFMPRNELHYFDRNENFAKGERWYLAHFDKATDNQIVGEKTPDYIWTNCHSTPGVSRLKHKRILDFRNDIKLIVIFRHPVERFVSALHHNRRRGRIPSRLGVSDLLKDVRHEKTLARMLEPGFYATQLEDYFELFDPGQIKILFHDDIKANPDGILSDVLEFLGVEKREFSDSNQNKRYNDYEATELGAALLRRTNGLLKSFVIKLDRYLLAYLPLTKVQYPTLSETDRAYLTTYYRNEMRKLPGMIGRSLPSAWKF